jgi:hypothetical protein
MPARRFPPPWSVEELEACFVVRDYNGQAPTQAGVIRPTFAVRSGRQVQQPAGTLSHFRGVAALYHFGD